VKFGVILDSHIEKWDLIRTEAMTQELEFDGINAARIFHFDCLAGKNHCQINSLAAFTSVLRTLAKTQPGALGDGLGHVFRFAQLPPAPENR
jgi:hypothetical protein